MSKKLSNIYYYIFSISLIFFLLYSAFYLACFLNSNSLYTLITKYKTYDNLPFNITSDELKTLAKELMIYISGKLEFLETKVSINGVVTDFYSLRSKIHMADVRNLILNFMYASFISVAISIFSLFKIIKTNGNIHSLKKTYSITLLITFILLISILLFAFFNFDAFFIEFHETLFSNDLWLLDPNEDYIICLLPEKIFMVYGIRIIITMIVFLFLPLLCLQILSKTQLLQEAK